MTLCLVGKEDLDEQQAYAVDMFSDIPNKNLPMQVNHALYYYITTISKLDMNICVLTVLKMHLFYFILSFLAEFRARSVRVRFQGQY